MRYFYLVLIALVLTISANAYDLLKSNVKVGTQPLEIFFDKSKMVAHVFCDGTDSAFNNVKDYYDENPSWWTIDLKNISTDNQFTAVKVKDFNFGSIGFTFRPIWDETARRIYISQLGKTQAYDIDTHQEIPGESYNIGASALAYDDNHIYFSIIDYSAPGKVIVYNRTKKQFTDTLSAGNMTRQCLSLDGKLYVLNEGNFGTYTGQLDVYTIDDFKNHKSVYLGSTANYLYPNDGKIYITMNYENKVLYYDTNLGIITDSIYNKDIPPGNFRECKITGYKMYISSYDGNIYLYNVYSNSLLASLESSGAVEGLDLSSNAIFATNIYKKGSYNYSDTVSIFFTEFWGVEDDTTSATIQIYPNPVQQNAHFKIESYDLLSGSASLKIYNASGIMMYSRSFGYISSNSFEAEINTESMGLARGTYYVEVNIGNKKYHSSFVTYN